MAEGDITVYNNAKEQLLLKLWDMDTDTFKVALLGSGYTPSVDGAAPLYGDATITTNEISTTNYVAGGKALTGLTVTQDDGNNRAKWDAADVTWTSLGTTTIGWAVIYDDTITTPAKPLVCYMEITTNSNGNNYTISWNANGIFYLT